MSLPSVRVKLQPLIPGPRGLTSQLTSVSAVALAAGQAPTVTNLGTPTDASLRFGIPNGFTGPAAAPGSAMFESRTAVASATIPSTGAGGPGFIYTAGYNVAGDGGQGLYKRRSGAPTDTTNPAYVQSVDGQWWELVPSMGAVCIEQFGGKGDSSTVGVGGTDNYPPTIWATQFIQWTFGVGSGAARYAPSLLFGAGNYRFAPPSAHPTYVFDFHQPLRISGTFGSGQYQGGTVWHFPQTCDPLIFGGDNTTGQTSFGAGGNGSSIGSVLENLSIWGGGGLSIFTDTNRFMIKCRATVTLRNLSLYGIPGHGILEWGGGGDGNANNFNIENVYIHEAGGHYLWVKGSDTNGSRVRGLVTHGEGGRGGCGILETGSLGCNTYEACQITGYGNTGVQYSGGLYQLISDVTNIGSTTTPGTNEQVWMYIGAVTGLENPVQFPTWSSSNTYIPQCPILSLNGANALVGNYCEVSAIQSHTPGSTVIGGNLPQSRYSPSLRGGGFGAPTVSNQALEVQRAHPTGTAEYTAHSETSRIIYGDARLGSDWGATGGQQIVRLQAKDGSWFEWGQRGPDLVMGRPGQYDHMTITGRDTAVTFRRSQPVPDVVMLGTIALVDNTTGDSILLGMKTSAASISEGEYGRNERYDYKDPSAGGYIGQVCVVGGVVASDWVTATWGVGRYKKMSNGKFYKVTVQGSGASTVEPTHSSGTATTADGYQWLWISNTAAVFKQYGAIEA